VKTPTAIDLFSMLVFPVVLAASIAATLALMDRGVEPALAFTGPVVGAYLFVMLCERFLPFHRSWQRSRGDVSVDLGHLLVSGGLTLELLRPLMLALAVAIGGWISWVVGAGIWPHSWPLVAQLVPALIIGEFLMYWVHRLAHEWDFLWRFHAVHHSSESIDWLAGSRLHLVDVLATRSGVLVPLFLLGFEQRALEAYLVFVSFHAVFIHANLRFSLRALEPFLVTPRFHHWHHSSAPEARDCNFAVHLPWLDRLFGSRHLPREAWPVGYGIAGRPVPPGWLDQTLYPFVER